MDRQSSKLQIVFSVGPGAKLRDRNGHLTDMWADFTGTRGSGYSCRDDTSQCVGASSVAEPSKWPEVG